MVGIHNRRPGARVQGVDRVLHRFTCIEGAEIDRNRTGPLGSIDQALDSDLIRPGQGEHLHSGAVDLVDLMIDGPVEEQAFRDARVERKVFGPLDHPQGTPHRPGSSR